ncbi:SCO5918 family protein [Streptomyces sp. NPDC094149]|uniref:SCO5918 family protein n=1 Tax=Streptomyces sp. NPDC094149 TaxID=3155079 RepID=UPI00332CD2A3
MRCVIARYPFELTKNGVLASMAGVRPEPVTGDAVTIGRRRYPVMQVGTVITRQDRRDFTGDEVTRAMARLGFTCHSRPEPVAPSTPDALTPLQVASALLGTPGPQDR